MSVGKVRGALTQAFLGAGIFDDTEVAWENRQFSPTAGQLWAAFFFMPNQPSVATLGVGGEDEVDGITQIDLNGPLGEGSAALDAIADQLRNIFTAGARFVYQGQEVVIRSCGRSQGRVEGSFFRISVTVMFYARINR